MIKQIVRVISLPFQSISDCIRHKRNQRKMMSYYLGIKQGNLQMMQKNRA